MPVPFQMTALLPLPQLIWAAYVVAAKASPATIIMMLFFIALYPFEVLSRNVQPVKSE